MQFYATEYRVTFADTDMMGVAYYANYLDWFEIGRAEYFRNLVGIPYTEIVSLGINTPVTEVYCKYIRPAHYDDLILINTRIAELKRASIKFEYKIILKEENEKLAEGYTIHAFINQDRKIIRIPKYIQEALIKLIE